MTDGKRRPRRTVDIDRHVGLRIRERRIMLGLTQEKFADQIGVTYQQAHKYEKGVNRVSSGRLWAIAKALLVDPAYFFEGVGGAEQSPSITPSQRMLLELGKNFSRLNADHQQAVLRVARDLANDGESHDNHS